MVEVTVVEGFLTDFALVKHPRYSLYAATLDINTKPAHAEVRDIMNYS